MTDRFGGIPDRADVNSFIAMDVLRRAGELKASGRDVLFLSVGQPAAPAPLAAREAAAELAMGGTIGYTDAGGRRDLRDALRAHYERTYGVAVESDRIFVTTGSSGGFVLSFLGFFSPGESIALASPGYAAYRNIIRSCSLDCREIAVDADSRWTLTADILERAWNGKPFQGLLIASPANPNGTMTPPDALGAICDWCERRNVRLISDEIYHSLHFAEETGIEQETALRFTDEAIVVNSFSKYFCMTGWRIGWLILPPSRVADVERLAQNLFICAPEISQVAARAALGETVELEQVREGYRRNRKLMLDRLPRLGFREVLPVDGAFYAYADASTLTDDTFEWCGRLLEDTGVAVTPGNDFDLERGHRYVRFSFAGAHEDIAEALDRIGTWLGEPGSR